MIESMLCAIIVCTKTYLNLLSHAQNYTKGGAFYGTAHLFAMCLKSAIVGTRNPGVSYQEWEKLLLGKINPDVIQMIISSGAKGIDTFGKFFAARHHKPYMEFTPQYSIY